MRLPEHRAGEVERRRDPRPGGERRRHGFGSSATREEAQERPQRVRARPDGQRLVGGVGEEHEPDPSPESAKSRQRLLDQLRVGVGDAPGEVERDHRAVGPTRGRRRLLRWWCVSRKAARPGRATRTAARPTRAASVHRAPRESDAGGRERDRRPSPHSAPSALSTSAGEVARPTGRSAASADQASRRAASASPGRSTARSSRPSQPRAFRRSCRLAVRRCSPAPPQRLLEPRAGRAPVGRRVGSQREPGEARRRQARAAAASADRAAPAACPARSGSWARAETRRSAVLDAGCCCSAVGHARDQLVRGPPDLRLPELAVAQCGRRPAPAGSAGRRGRPAARSRAAGTRARSGTRAGRRRRASASASSPRRGTGRSAGAPRR